MNLFPLVLIFSLILSVIGYRYLSPYHWKVIREKLQSNKLQPDEKYKIKKLIYDRYKYRTYIKAKEFKLLNKHMCKNISVEQLGYFALEGLVNSINNFEPTSPVNFARVSDKYINTNLVQGTTKKIFKMKAKIPKQSKWYESYWTCVNYDLGPDAKRIINLKFSKNFDKLKSNKEISTILNIEENKVNKIIIDSLDLINKKVQSNYDIAYTLFINKTN